MSEHGMTQDPSTLTARPILVTGAAGFIGAHVARELGRRGHAVNGCDNFNSYYDPALKHARVDLLLAPAGVPCLRADIADAAAMQALFDEYRPIRIIHLAAQAGVRHSIARPHEYVASNLVGFANLLEAARMAHVEHLVYASSSSVYGARTDPPFRESDATDSPVSFYAATKKSNAVMAQAYGHIQGLST